MGRPVMVFSPGDGRSSRGTEEGRGKLRVLLGEMRLRIDLPGTGAQVGKPVVEPRDQLAATCPEPLHDIGIIEIVIPRQKTALDATLDRSQMGKNGRIDDRILGG